MQLSPSNYLHSLNQGDTTCSIKCTLSSDVSTVDPHSFSQLTESSHKALALDLMMRLAKDDGFREMMIRDPVAATSQYGIDLDPEKLPKEG